MGNDNGLRAVVRLTLSAVFLNPTDCRVIGLRWSFPCVFVLEVVVWPLGIAWSTRGPCSSVVRSDLVSNEDWILARNSRNFQTAGGEHLVGGQRGVFVRLSFTGSCHEPSGSLVSCKSWLYEAAISQDAVLSYEFLCDFSA